MSTTQSKSEYVEAMFARISGRYDLLNTVMTLGMHRRWKSATAKIAAGDHPGPALDVATGTGDLALELAKQPRITEVTGVDFCPEMIELANKKVAKTPTRVPVSYVEGDALNLDFQDDSFVCATSGFALRNVDSIVGCLSEMRRVIKPGGRVAVLELTPLKASFPVSALLDLYFSRCVPLLGQVLAGDREAYTYLPNSVDGFPTAKELSDLFREAGLVDVGYRKLNMGTVAIHWGTKPYST